MAERHSTSSTYCLPCVIPRTSIWCKYTPAPSARSWTTCTRPLDPWLGIPRWCQKAGRIALVYRVQSGDTPPLKLRLKIEINAREHFSAFEFRRIPFSVESRWFDGAADILTYELDELLATKMRALYQRKKARDLFDPDAGTKQRRIKRGPDSGCIQRLLGTGGRFCDSRHVRKEPIAKVAGSAVFSRHKSVA